MLAARSALPRAVHAVFGAPLAAQRVPVRALGSLGRAIHTWDDVERRSWVDAFRAQPLTTQDVHISFARSSGPGGQNVNKLNTKAHARYDLQNRALPQPLVRALAKRSLHAEILRVASEGLRGETSPEQRQRVARLDKRHRERVKKEKQMRSLTKSGRRAKP
ncbi:aminoacyl-tRNA hydrolase [Malassezia brasiliensis]|uniref:Aminoacyl-tRNA hydrolase n=1 Tax=Malassezia brasiliensis TaxID=1821822 RepID=A0AAF0ITW0_9BASI|nr:aminoacyl-tRNA hydrolase [Malassezia brasiliensis]